MPTDDKLPVLENTPSGRDDSIMKRFWDESPAVDTSKKPRSVRQKKRLCQLCRHAHPSNGYINGVRLMECRRRSPTAYQKPAPGVRAYWPLVLATEWCAEYGTKE